jgi:sec-independent protein translocase protein TatA
MTQAMASLLFLWMPSATELIIIAVVILLLFGGRKIPELMRGLGKGVKEFKEATNDEEKKGEGPPSGTQRRDDQGDKDRKEQ